MTRDHWLATAGSAPPQLWGRSDIDRQKEQRMRGKGDYEHPAWCKMETALDSYEQDRAKYLKSESSKLGPDGSEKLARFNKAADSLVKGMQDLAGAEGIGSLAELASSIQFEDSKPFELLDEHMCVTCGWEAMAMLSTARDRFLDLLLLLRNRQPCDRARAFLQRVARCYLFGFDAECVVMCRAVLDRDFEAEISGDDVECWWGWYKSTDNERKRKNAPHNLWGRIQTALFKCRLTQEEFDAADTVRNRGNDAVHKKPAGSDALARVRETVQVLDGLEKTRHLPPS
jgi:hypothetical protein